METRDLVCIDENLSVDYCKFCGAIRVGHRWVPGGDFRDAIDNYVLHYLPARRCSDYVESYSILGHEYLTDPSWRSQLSINFKVKLRGFDKEIKLSKKVTIRLNPAVCPSCKMARSGDHKVLVRVRGAPVRELARSLLPVLDESANVAKSIIDIVEYKNGVDIYLSSKAAASRILRELKRVYRGTLKVDVSAEDVTVDSRGKHRKRVVYTVRVG
jgi:nonsense-mediated mRNA decay protein 3